MLVKELIAELQKLPQDITVDVLNLYSPVKPSEAHQVINHGSYVVITTEALCSCCDGEGNCEECGK